MGLNFFLPSLIKSGCSEANRERPSTVDKPWKMQRHLDSPSGSAGPRSKEKAGRYRRSARKPGKAAGGSAWLPSLFHSYFIYQHAAAARFFY